MATIKNINESESQGFVQGSVIIKATSGDAHPTTIGFFKGFEPIGNGNDSVERTYPEGKFSSGDKIIIDALIDRADGSDWVSLTIEITNNGSTKTYEYSSQQEDYDSVHYEVTITLN